MKPILMILVAIFFAQVGFAQSPGELKSVTESTNGGMIFNGLDPLGADVTVVYNSDLVKVYQERTIDGETTFARFDNGKVVDYGVYGKPMVTKSADLSTFSLRASSEDY